MINRFLYSKEISAVLYRGTSGVLALSGDNNYPYAVPISYVYDGEKIYFHCAKSGHKLDAIQQNEKVSFCVIDQNKIVPDEYTSYFRSVIAFGKIQILDNTEDKMEAIKKLAAKYSPLESTENTQETINSSWERFCIARLSIRHLSGKQAKELVNPV